MKYSSFITLLREVFAIDLMGYLFYNIFKATLHYNYAVLP